MSASTSKPNQSPLWNPVLGLAFVAIFCWTLSPLAGYDFWFYLAMGEFMVQRAEIPWSESFLGSTAGYGFGKYASQAWLGNLICYLAFWSLGPLGLVLLKSLLLTGTTALTYVNCRLLGLGALWSVLWSTLGLWSIRGRFEMRTYLFTDLFLAGLLFLLLKQREGRSQRPKQTVLLVALVIAVWANVHQGVLAGCTLLFLWVVFGGMPRKTGLAALGSSGLALLLQPRGWEFPKFLYDHFANPSALGGVVEWGAPSWGILSYQLGPFLLTLSILIPWGVFQRRRKSQPLPPLFYLGIALFFLILGLRSIRAISELLPVVVPLAAAYFPRGQGPKLLRIGATVVCISLMVLTFRPFSWQQLTSVDNRYPTALLQALPRDGQVFNSFEHGNLLVFKGVPPFIHGMTGLYKEELLQDYIDVLNADPKTPEILERFGVESMLLHFPSSLDATGNLLEYLTRSPEWQLKVFDDQGLVYIQAGDEGRLSALRPWDLDKPWTDPELAEAQLTRLVRDWPSALAYVLLSRLAAEREDWSSAKRHAEKAVQSRPDLYQSWYQYGLVAAKTGHLAGLLEATRNTVRLAPNEATAHLHRGLALEALRETRTGLPRWWATQRAWYHLRRALFHDPSLEPAERHLRAL